MFIKPDFFDISREYIDGIDTSRFYVDIFKKYRHIMKEEIYDVVRPEPMSHLRKS